jgi:endoglucanase
VIALKRGTKNGASAQGARGAKSEPVPFKLLVEGHMDEIGLMVTKIDKGFIRFTEVGGFDVRVLLGQEVLVHGKRALPGIIGSRPPHVLSASEREKVIPMADLFIDVGLPEAQVGELVQPGDLVTIARKMLPLKNNLVAGKAFDDRAAVVTVIDMLRQLKTMQHACDVYAVANVQEEDGAWFGGAFTSTFKIRPDVAVALDVSHADQPGTTEVNQVPLNGGPGIAMGPNIHPKVHAKLVEVAGAHEIPYKVTAYAGATGTDAWAIQVTAEGIPTGLLDLPLRYMHTSVETLSITDLERTARLLAHFAAALDDKFFRELKGLDGEEAKEEKKTRRTRGRKRGK